MILDLILPCYNPPDSWADEVIRSIQDVENKLNGSVHLILVNDGSTKNVSESDIQWLRKNITHFTYKNYKDNKGKGYAVRYGLRSVQTPFVIFTDIDMPYNNEGIVKYYHLLKNDKADICIPVRHDLYYSQVPTVRRIISKSFRGIIKYTLKLTTGDTQGGLKGFTRAGAKILEITSVKGFLFDLELILLAERSKLRITEVPVELKSNTRFVEMNIITLIRESRNLWKIYNL